MQGLTYSEGDRVTLATDPLSSGGTITAIDNVVTGAGAKLADNPCIYVRWDVGRTWFYTPDMLAPLAQDQELAA